MAAGPGHGRSVWSISNPGSSLVGALKYGYNSASYVKPESLSDCGAMGLEVWVLPALLKRGVFRTAAEVLILVFLKG